MKGDDHRSAEPKQPLAAQAPTPRFHGKYRGRVLDSDDPEARGRVRVLVDRVTSVVGDWALPNLPYTGADEGLEFIPPPGTSVWIEFEGGDPTYPIWTGCFIDKDDSFGAGTGPHGSSDHKRIRTRRHEVVFDDGDGGAVTLSAGRASDGSAATEIRVGPLGIQVRCGATEMSLDPTAGIVLRFGQSMVAIDADGVCLQGNDLAVRASALLGQLANLVQEAMADGEPDPPTGVAT